MKILAIESSCDETAAAVIGDHASILSNVVVSQIDIFAAYGGVIPEVAARSHLEAILPVVHKALDDASLTKDDIDYIAVTYAPGLLGSLLIGTLTARMLAILWHKPLYAIHHLKSHIYSNWLHEEENASNLLSKSFSRGIKRAPKLDVKNDIPVKTSNGKDSSKKALTEKNALPSFPLLSLVISGGHTQIIYMPTHNQFEIIGTTRDDAVGECFDKVAKILGLPYPGGPSIARCALGEFPNPDQSPANHSKKSQSNAPTKSQPDTSDKSSATFTQPLHPGDPTKYPLPHPQINGLDFSFSGLKTAVLRAVQKACNLPITTPSYELQNYLTSQQKSDFAASFQATACDILLEKLDLALTAHPNVKSLVFAGGVSANQELRQRAYSYPKWQGLPIYFPAPKFSGDNAAMVGAAAYYEILSGVTPTDPYQLNISPRTPIH